MLKLSKKIENISFCIIVNNYIINNKIYYSC